MEKIDLEKIDVGEEVKLEDGRWKDRKGNQILVKDGSVVEKQLRFKFGLKYLGRE